ncbi:MAG: sugar transferase [Candidatus Moranbacteria bacterium]|nr:sugar transferase [Candidatus Moranbacteria bacterium]
MKRSEIFFSAIQVPVDFIMIVLAATSAYFLRGLPMFEGYVSHVFSIEFADYLDFVLIITPFFIVILAIEGLYRIRATRRFVQEAYGVTKAITFGLIILIIAVFLNREWFSSRFVILVGWMFAIAFVVIARYGIQRIQNFVLVHRGMGVHRVLLIGYNEKMKKLRNQFVKNKSLGYRVVDQIDTASIKYIKTIRETKGVDEIIVGDPSLTDDEQEKLFDYCQIHNITYRYFPTTLQTQRFSMHIWGGEPIIEFQHTPLDGWGKLLKRLYDIVAGTVLFILFFPIMLCIAACIKLEDPKGPVIYKNERIGENGRKFFVYKFRYMQWKYCITKENPAMKEAIAFEKKLIEERNVRQGGVLYKIKDDPRRMRVGTFIERYSLDEFPQFWNVLKGDMSLVGPRPHQEREVERYSEYHRRLLTIRPGVTGMAQVSGRSDLSFEDEYRLDVFYIENWSLWLDVLICLKTAGALIKHRKNGK